jgi:hypothetical protein
VSRFWGSATNETHRESSPTAAALDGGEPAAAARIEGRRSSRRGR